MCNEKHPMESVALIDGDSFLYRAGFAVEKTRYLVRFLVEGTEDDYESWEANTKKEADELVKKFGPGSVIWTRKELGSLDDAVAIMDAMIQGAIRETNAKNPFVYLTPSTGNFRDSIGTVRKYKGNRDGQSRPVYYSDLREHLLSAHQAIIARGEEADDQISWVARSFLKQGKDYVIIGIDKDLKQIPGKHYDWVEKKHFEFTEDESRLFYWAQVLAGDSGDNIGGCWKLGFAKAEHFLLQCNGLSDDEMWPKIVRKFKESQKLKDCPYANHDAGEVALETARLVRLRQEVNEKIWTPKEPGKEADPTRL